MISPSQVEKEVKEIIQEEEKIYDREQEVEKKIDKIKEREIEEELIEDNKIKTKSDIKEEKKRFGFFKKITEKKLTEEDVNNILKELEMAMMENDVAVEVVEKISSSLKKELVGASVKRGDVEKIITEALRKAMFSVLGTEHIDIEKLIESKPTPASGSPEPLLVMMLGFNGVGKTTTLAKLAHKYKKYSPVLAAGDTFRAASIEQLEEHSRRLDVKIVKSKYGADSAAVIFDAKKHAAAIGSKVVFADTAGRSHTNVNLMDELRKVVRVNKPDLKVLVLDSLAGNDIYEQARLFDEAVGVDAIILTKSDVYDRGGAALSAAYALKKPILFLGTGQEYTDLIEFSPQVIVKNLLE
ncbi:MAG: signal recognition particle-docking protein FtsY [Candidatus Aenigmarchaeota archaeon]|nr:signal recognition particle-docking protein FtsY [Candidatus Aenigmarchaeota archaeon]